MIFTCIPYLLSYLPGTQDRGRNYPLTKNSNRANNGHSTAEREAGARGSGRGEGGAEEEKEEICVIFMQSVLTKWGNKNVKEYDREQHIA